MSLNDDFIFRPARPEDYQEINRAYNSVTGRRRTIDQYLWQWVDTPFPSSESWIIRDPADEKLAGHIGVMYIPCQDRGTKVAVGKTENTFVLPSYTKRLYYPSFEKRLLGRLAERFDFLYTTAEGAGRGVVGKIRRRLGYKPSGIMTTFGLWFRPRALADLAAGRFGFSPVLWRLAAQGHHAWQNANLALKRGSGYECSCVPWSRVAAAAEFWQEQREHYPLSPERGQAYYEWRFAHNPHRKYQLHQISLHGHTRGYAVTSTPRVVSGERPFNATLVEDLVVLGNREETYLGCLASLVHAHRRSELILIIALRQEAPLNRALDRLMGMKAKLQALSGPNLLTWAPEGRQPQWYFTNALSEGVAYAGQYHI